MKIGSATENTLITNTGGTNKFKIEATGKAFQILSSALYSHKVKAVVREIGCNAYDAHIDAGTTSTPFEVSLPSKEDPHFKVRDFGIGLAEDKFVEVYTTYFGSSKSNSNDHTGGLGLGSKTPFIMSKSFTVHSYYNGTEFMWHSFVNDNGQPDVVLLTSKATTEPNGLLVIVPIGHGLSVTEQNALYREFEAEAATIYKWFDVVPNIKRNGKAVVVEKILQSATTKYTPIQIKGIDGAQVFYNTEQLIEGQSDSVLVKMGNVVYPYKLTEVKGLDRFGGNLIHTEAVLKYLTAIGRLNSTKSQLVVDVGVGGVDVAPSREALSLTNSTELTIINILVRFIDLFCKEVQDTIDNAKTTYDKYQALYLVPPVKGKLFTIDSKEINPSKQKPNWVFDTDVGIAKKGHNCLRSFSIDSMSVKLRRAGARGILPVKNEVLMNMYGPDVRARMIILVDTGYKGELRNWVNANADSNAAVVVVFGTDYALGVPRQRPLTAAEMESFLEDGHLQVVKFSQLAHKPVIVPRTNNIISVKVTNETGLQLLKVDTNYNYFTSGNSRTVMHLDEIVKNHNDRMNKHSITPYVIFRKKGDAIETHLYNTDEKKVQLQQVGKWSRSSSHTANWSEDAVFLSKVCVEVPDEIKAGLKCYADPANILTCTSKRPNQLVLSPTAYDEIAADPTTYPMFFTVDRWFNQVLLPSLPKVAEWIELEEVQMTGCGYSFRHPRAIKFLETLGWHKLIQAQDQIRQQCNDPVSSSVVTFNANVMAKKCGYNLNVNSVTLSYKVSEHTLMRGVQAAVSFGIPGAVALSSILQNMVGRGGIGKTLYGDGYRLNEQSIEFMLWSIKHHLSGVAYTPTEFDAFMVKHLLDSAQRS